MEITDTVQRMSAPRESRCRRLRTFFLGPFCTDDADELVDANEVVVVADEAELDGVWLVLAGLRRRRTGFSVSPVVVVVVVVMDERDNVDDADEAVDGDGESMEGDVTLRNLERRCSRAIAGPLVERL